MAENPYLSPSEVANADQPRIPLAPRAVRFAIASWLIVFLQALSFLVAVFVARSGGRETGVTILIGIHVLGAISVVTTVVSTWLAITAWFREERTKPIVIATLLSVAHGILLIFAALVLIAASFAQ